MICAFKKDANDPERIGIHESNVAFYYNKYTRKQFSIKYYNVDTTQAVVDMVKDSVTLNKEKQVLETSHSDELESFDIFCKLTEESRRARQRRIDAGDETAVLKFTPQLPPPR